MSGTSGHLDLLAIARCVRDSVERDHTEDLHAALTRLRTAVMGHVHAESTHLDALPGYSAAVALQGQRRLLRLLTDVLFAPDDSAGLDDCNCVVRAAEIELAVRRQVRLEVVLLRRHPQARSSGT